MYFNFEICFHFNEIVLWILLNIDKWWFYNSQELEGSRQHSTWCRKVKLLVQFQWNIQYENHDIAIAMSSYRADRTGIEYSTGLTGGI